MTSEFALIAAPIIPLAAALLVSLSGKIPNLRDSFSVLAGIILFGTVVSIVPDIMAGGRPAFTVVEVMPGLALGFLVEPLGMLFALVASGLWIVTTIYAIGYMRGHEESNQTRFFASFAVAIFASIGVAFASNLLTLFMFYELLTLSTYPLVTHQRTDEAMRAGRVYLGILFTTSICFLLFAVIWTWVITGTTDFTPGGILAGKAEGATVGVLLALFAFGTGKAALMPFHRWLPAAMVAPTPVSALLHAVAVVKAGVFTIMKIVVYIFGISFLASTGSNQWLIWVASATIVLASLVALTKDNLKARLAYSTVSQLSYIVLGAALANQAGVVGGSMHIAMHAFGKITLFFCAGAIYVAHHKTKVSEMNGIGRQMPITLFAFLIGSLSVIGLPPFGGSWSKWFITMGAYEAEQMIPFAILMVSSLLNVAYLLPIVFRGFFLAPKETSDDGHVGHVSDHDGPSPGIWKIGALREAPLFCVLPICMTAFGCLVLFFYASEMHKMLLPLGAP